MNSIKTANCVKFVTVPDFLKFGPIFVNIHFHLNGIFGLLLEAI